MTKSVVRVGFVVVLLLSAGVLVGTNVFGGDKVSATPVQGTQIAPERGGITVATSHLGYRGKIVALDADGSLLYSNASHDGYWDVDPSPEGEATVLYSATDRLVRGDAGCQKKECVRQVVERVNLTTGEVTTLYTSYAGQYHASEWHDIDRLNRTHIVVADMANDRVFVVDTSSGIITWEWQVQNDFPLESGGPYPEDWAHLNDVEVLPDGRIMVSLRNQDQVVFLDRRTGMLENWTLGAEDARDELYEQHNPDYIPADHGGPAVVVADSENNRIVEYQRRNGGWERTWQWADAELQWPRDADRLPNGNTLISDTYGKRVVEIDRDGEVRWTFDVTDAGMSSVYEAERLGTGDESTGGASATALGLQSRTENSVRDVGGTSLTTTIRVAVKSLFPTKWVNGLSSVMPVWMQFYDLLLLVVLFVTTLTWGVAELWWAKYRLRSPLARA